MQPNFFTRIMRQIKQHYVSVHIWFLTDAGSSRFQPSIYFSHNCKCCRLAINTSLNKVKFPVLWVRRNTNEMKTHEIENWHRSFWLNCSSSSHPQFTWLWMKNVSILLLLHQNKQMIMNSLFLFYRLSHIMNAESERKMFMRILITNQNSFIRFESVIYTILMKCFYCV